MKKREIIIVEPLHSGIPAIARCIKIISKRKACLCRGEVWGLAGKERRIG